MSVDRNVYIHPTAIVETDDIGQGTRIWAFVHVQQGAHVGQNCNVGNHCFIETGASVGNNVTVKNNVCVWEGVAIKDGVFIGPNVTFTNDRFPRSPRLPIAEPRYRTTAQWLESTVVAEGCSIGANATILPNVRLGAFAMIGAGSVVTADVPPHTLVIGSPARPMGYVCRCGQPLKSCKQEDQSVTCAKCGFALCLSHLKLNTKEIL